jgi:hypothetical protein
MVDQWLMAFLLQFGDLTNFHLPQIISLQDAKKGELNHAERR